MSISLLNSHLITRAHQITTNTFSNALSIPIWNQLLVPESDQSTQKLDRCPYTMKHIFNNMQYHQNYHHYAQHHNTWIIPQHQNISKQWINSSLITTQPQKSEPTLNSKQLSEQHSFWKHDGLPITKVMLVIRPHHFTHLHYDARLTKLGMGP